MGINRGSAMGLKGFLLTGSLLFLELTNAQDCCQKKVVTAPAEHAGTFTFVRKFDGEKDSNCADACIYSKDGADGDEFCFKAVVLLQVVHHQEAQALVQAHGQQLEVLEGLNASGTSRNSSTNLEHKNVDYKQHYFTHENF